MCALLGIEKTRTTPLHPQSDGMVERFNRTIEAQLSKFVADHQEDWDQCVSLLLMAYRTSIHETTGCTPAMMMMGRDLRLPIDLIFGRPREEPSPLATDYADSLQRKLEQIHDFARPQLKMQSDRMKERYDLHLSGQALNAGEAVWLYNPRRKKGLSPKLSRSWEGPYTVTKRINDVVYRIQLGPRTKPKVVHRNRLWKYSGSAVPTWFQDKDGSTQSVQSVQPPQAPEARQPSSPEPLPKPVHVDATPVQDAASTGTRRYPQRQRKPRIPY